MRSIIRSDFQSRSNNSAIPTIPVKMKMVDKSERKLLKLVLLCHFHQFLSEYYQDQYLHAENNNLNLNMELYAMDTKVIQFIIRDILESESYTLEGIATYTRFPLDVIVDAVSGKNTNLSITFWARLIDLYRQVRPEILKTLLNKYLAVLADENNSLVSVLVSE